MNKLKQAIAYLIDKIKTTYYATRFFVSILTLEFPHDRLRVDGRARDEASGLREAGGRSNTPCFDRPSAIANSTIAVDTARQDYCTSVNTSNPSCDGMFGFLGGDFLDGFGNPCGYESTATQGCIAKNLQSREATNKELKRDREWDLLEPRDRQAVILHAMWQYQAEFDYHQLFSVHLVMVLCDRPQMQWEQTFDDLVALKYQEKLVLCEAHDERGKKFYGFLWGVK